MKLLHVILIVLVVLSVTVLSGCLQENGRNSDTLQFKSASYLTEEIYKNLSVTVIKTGTAPCNVSFTTSDGTALAGVDYTATSGTLEFKPSDTQKDIVIPVTVDGWYTSPKDFTVKLTSSGGATIRGPDSATVTINASRVVGLYNWTSDTGNHIVDQSGLGNNGVNNKTVLGYDNGSAYRYFDGNHYWVNVPSSDSLNITAGTFEAVIKTNKSYIFNTFLCKRYYAKQGGYWFGTSTGGYVYCYFQNTAGNITSFNLENKKAPGSFVCDGKDHFVAVSYNTTQYVVMVDGKVVYTNYSRHDPIGLTPCTFQISDVINAANHGMTGNIYWERIANGAETASQMQQDYQAEAWRVSTNVRAQPETTTTVNISVDPTAPGDRIPEDFLGLSYELPTVAQGQFDPNNTVLMTMIKNLGPGVLRFGGNWGEGTYWSRTGENFSGVTPRAVGVIKPDDLDSLFSFVNDAGWKVILGLNLAHYDPGMAADEAAYAKEASARNGDPLLAFAIGNEPSFYKDKNPNFNILERPANYTYGDYIKEYDGYKSAIREKVPNAPLAGPEEMGYWPAGFNYHLNWYTDFLNDEANDTSLATLHYYAALPLLGDVTMTTEESMIETSMAIANKHDMPLRFDESGSDGYDLNLSSSLWSADYLFRLAKNGAAGANFHGSLLNSSQATSYSPISTNGGHYQANSIYYGMLLFHYAGQGRIIPVDSGTSDFLRTYATLGDDGKVRIVLINTDISRNVTAHVMAEKPYESVTAMRLIGDSLDSSNNITFGGSRVGADGTWSPVEIETVGYQDGYYELNVPTASAALITMA